MNLNTIYLSMYYIAEERLQSDAACGDFIHTPKGTLPDALVRHLIDLDKALV